VDVVMVDVVLIVDGAQLFFRPTIGAASACHGT
jgi:hypothetical protein